jgi:hypothetical protein
MKQLTSILSFLVSLEGSLSRAYLFLYHNRPQERSFHVYTKVHNTFFILKKAYYSAIIISVIFATKEVPNSVSIYLFIVALIILFQ